MLRLNGFKCFGYMLLIIDSDIGMEKDDKFCYDIKSVNVFFVVLNVEV